MIFRIAAGGDLTGKMGMIRKVDELSGQIKAYLASAGKEQDIQIEWLVSPSYTGEGWKKKALADQVKMHAFCRSGEEDWSGDCCSMVKADSALRGIAADWLCTKADLLMIVWNEEVAEFGGATWELMQNAYRRKAPCVWISSKSGDIYWLQDGYYEAYVPGRLQDLCQSLAVAEDGPGEESGKSIPFLELGDRLQRRFLRKYDAVYAEQPAEKDLLLQEGYEYQEGNAYNKNVHRKLLEEFGRYDRKAVEYAGKYRAIMYWRAILPLIASVFICIGFYAETLLGILPLPQILQKNILPVVAGFGFLIHGMLNLYSYFLSKDKVVDSWHKGYINNRNIAEMYRVLLHFLPYGVNIDLRKLCGGRWYLYAPVRRVVREIQPMSVNINREETKEMLGHVSEMLEDQMAYHKSAGARYQRVADKLLQWGRCLFAVGFAVVILRGFFQFFVVYMPFSGTVNGISLNSYIRSLANMAALLLPAWASYFSSKLNQCNYGYHARNHAEMEKALAAKLKRIRRLQDEEQGMALEMLDVMVEEVAEVMLMDDTSAWYNKVASSSVTSL